MKHANVALFVPHVGCPNQCSFCNQHSITGTQTLPTGEDVTQAAQKAKQDLAGKDVQAELAFFGGSFTAIDRAYMLELLNAAQPFVQDKTFSGIRISTRPDAIDEEILSLLREKGVTSIELGAQSMDDRVLALNRRGHTAYDVQKASALIRQYGFSLGLQMMTGLYGDTAEGAVRTADSFIALHPDTVRIYPTIVMQDTELCRLFQVGEYTPMTLEQAVELCALLLVLFEEHNIKVIRLGLHDTPELKTGMIAGPWHPAFRELCESRCMMNRVRGVLQDEGIEKGEILIRVHPKNISRMTGQKRSNLLALKQAGFGARVIGDDRLDEKSITIEKSR